jgi:hypothetical protein
MRIDSAGNVGIGTQNPDRLLELSADIPSGDGRYLLKLHNQSTSSKSTCGLQLFAGQNDVKGYLGLTSETYDDGIREDIANRLSLGTTGKSINITNINPHGYIRFATGGEVGSHPAVERVRIDSAGNVGIGTTQPSAKLEITDGDIYINNIERGIIMKSPSGQCWRGTLDDSGMLSFQPVDCPDGEGVSKSDDPLSDSESFEVYPNPSKDIIMIRYEGNIQGKVIALYSIEGMLLKSESMLSTTSTLNLSAYNPGTYIIQIMDESGRSIATEKIIIA